MNIMPPPKPSVCEMPLNGAKDCVVVESLRCPYCLAAVEIRKGDNWTTYWCPKHGAIENPLSFSDTTLADGRSPTRRPDRRVSAASFGLPSGIPLPEGFFESSRMRLAESCLFQFTSLNRWPGASREGLRSE